MKTIDVYAVITNSDLGEGRGHDYTIANFTDENVAKQASLKQGVQGTAAEVKKSVIMIFDNIEEYMEHTGREVVGITDKIRREALAKLTPMERKILKI